jgi:hypothetical protein
MRAVRARRAALTFALTGFLEVLAVRLAGRAAALPGVPSEFARVLVVWLAGFALDFFTAPEGFAVFFAAVAFFSTVGASFFAGFGAAVCADFFVVEETFFLVLEAEAEGAVAEPLEDCPANGSTISSVKSRNARRRVASRRTNKGRNATLISSL